MEAGVADSPTTGADANNDGLINMVDATRIERINYCCLERCIVENGFYFNDPNGKSLSSHRRGHWFEPITTHH